MGKAVTLYTPFDGFFCILWCSNLNIAHSSRQRTPYAGRGGSDGQKNGWSGAKEEYWEKACWWGIGNGKLRIGVGGSDFGGFCPTWSAELDPPDNFSQEPNFHFFSLTVITGGTRNCRLIYCRKISRFICAGIVRVLLVHQRFWTADFRPRISWISEERGVQSGSKKVVRGSKK